MMMKIKKKMHTMFNTNACHRPLGRRSSAGVCLLAVTVGLASPADAQVSVPASAFQSIEISPLLNEPVAMAFAPDGRLFIAERAGIVKVVQNGSVISTFINLTDEVNYDPGSDNDRGLLGLALDPNFLSNRRVYLSYSVDPVSGPPDSPGDVATFSRVTRYQGSAASGGNVADNATRTILIGATPPEGIPQCWRSHSTGALRFGADGSLLIAHGDSAIFGPVDSGGGTPQCFTAQLFSGTGQDIGAFRSQMLDSMDGKILRVDPDTGNGISGNPFYNAASPASPRSRLWVSGLRNPYRFNVRPGTGGGKSPGTLYIGDVGWNTYEEISAAKTGGENFGWPCREGFAVNTPYSSVNLPTWGCASIGTPGNPGTLTPPLIAIHHFNANSSVPIGTTGACVVAGAFHSGNSYPSPWRGGFFYADNVTGAIRVLRTNASDVVMGINSFGASGDAVVDFAVDPVTGDVCVLTMFNAHAYRLQSLIGPGDVNRDGTVNVADLLAVITAWGPCSNPLTCPADLNVSGQIDVADLLEVISNWG